MLHPILCDVEASDPDPFFLFHLLGPQHMCMYTHRVEDEEWMEHADFAFIFLCVWVRHFSADRLCAVNHSLWPVSNGFNSGSDSRVHTNFCGKDHAYVPH